MGTSSGRVGVKRKRALNGDANLRASGLQVGLRDAITHPPLTEADRLALMLLTTVAPFLMSRPRLRDFLAALPLVGCWHPGHRTTLHKNRNDRPEVRWGRVGTVRKRRRTIILAVSRHRFSCWTNVTIMKVGTGRRLLYPCG